MNRQLAVTAVAAAAAWMLYGCATPAPTAVACDGLPAALASLPGLPGLRVAAAESVALDDKGHPAHCKATGRRISKPIA